MSGAFSGLSFGGLFSGLDTESIITQLMNIERAPVRLIEQKQTKLGFEKDELNTINNNLLTLKNTLKTFVSGIAFENDVTSGDSAIVTGTANAASNAGTHTFDALNLAQEQIVSSTTQAAGWTEGVGGTITIDVDGGAFQFDIAIAAGDDLGTIAGKINSAIDNGPGTETFSDYATAYLVEDPATGNQTLLIKAEETGVANRIDINDTVGTVAELSLGLINATNVENEVQAALDANAVIDGINVSSDTNTFINAITGVTLTMNEADPGNPVEIQIGLADDDIVMMVSDFVSQFNSNTDMLASYIKEKPISDPESSLDWRTGILNGDNDLQMTKTSIRMKTTGYIDSSQTTYQILAQLGIESEASVGSSVSDNIEFDEQKLRDALANNKDEAIALLEGWATELDNYLDAQTKVSVIQTDAGNYYRRITSIEDRIDSLGDDIVDWEARLATMEETMRFQWAAMEQALAQMQSQSSYLTAQLGNLTGSSSS